MPTSQEETDRYGTAVPADSHYECGNWREVEVAVLGGTDKGVSEVRLATAEISDPGSFTRAGDAFYQVADALQNALTTFTYYVTALVGDSNNGPWTGDAATVFADNANFFSQAMQNQLDALTAGPLWNSLYASGSYLEWAIQEVNAIDSYYASEAQRVMPGTTATT